MVGMPLFVAAALAGAPLEGAALVHRHLEVPAARLELAPEAAPAADVRVTEPLDLGPDWTEAVLSWTADAPGGARLAFEARGVYPDRTTKWYHLGHWTEDRALAPRESVDGQRDADGDVQTDTLVLRRPGARLQVRVTATPGPDGRRPRLERLDVVASGPSSPPARPAAPAAWGRTIDVPIRAQGDYPNGNVLCSPTSVSMVLWHWARELDRPELDHDVPLVQEGVYDRTWGGTGNWSFNTAFAARLPGLRARVARLHDLAELEAWVARGVPVVCSVSYDFLKGKPERGANDGHLVIVVGFTPEGDPVFNDPGRKPIRLVYRRADFDRAWATSRRTVYLIHPRTWSVPALGGEPASD